MILEILEKHRLLFQWSFFSDIKNFEKMLIKGQHDFIKTKGGKNWDDIITVNSKPTFRSFCRI